MGDSIIRGTENSWANFSNNLVSDFQQQYGAQSSIFSFLTGKFTDMVNNPQGFSPAALSALRGGAVDTISKQFNNAKQALGAGMAAQGSFGGDVKSGVNAQLQGNLAYQQAGATANELGGIELQNEQQKISNQRFAEQGLNEIGVEENPTGFAGAATSAAGETGQLGSEYFSTDQSGFGDVLGKSFASGLGNVLSGNAVLSGSGASKVLGEG